MGFRAVDPGRRVYWMRDVVDESAGGSERGVSEKLDRKLSGNTYAEKWRQRARAPLLEPR